MTSTLPISVITVTTTPTVYVEPEPETSSVPTTEAEPEVVLDPDATDPCSTDRCLTMVFSGDTLLHEPLWEQARADGSESEPDFFPLLAGQEPYVAAADLAVCHLETPLAEADGPFQGFPNFIAPPQIADGLAQAGYDACTTASNHSFDGGTAALDRTLDTLEAAGLAHAGTARTRAEAHAPTVLDVAGVAVGLISGTYGLNGHVPDSAWQVTDLEPNWLIDQARKAKEAGAQIVVVSVHAGVEYQQEPTSGQQELAATLLADPAIDLVVGHHAHVVQPVEQIGGKWVLYGLGNSVAAHGIEDVNNREGILARVRFAQQPDGTWTTDRVRWIPGVVHNAAPYRWCSLIGPKPCVGEQADAEALERIGAAVTARTDGAVRFDRQPAGMP